MARGQATESFESIPSVEGVEHRSVEVRGIRLHVAEAGKGDPVLLLHGWPQHWYVWRKVIPALAQDNRVIAPDLRGFGWSDAPSGGYEKHELARDVLALMDELEIERAHVIGHDWGGFVAFLLGIEHSDRVGSILALGTAPPWPVRNPLALLDSWRLAYQPVLAAPVVGPLALRSPLARLIGRGPRERDTFAERLQGRDRRHATQQLYRSFTLRELPALMLGRYTGSRLRARTHLMVGDKDPVLTGRILGSWQDHAERMTVERLEDVGHALPEDRAELVVERARALFSEAPLRAKKEKKRAAGAAAPPKAKPRPAAPAPPPAPPTTPRSTPLLESTEHIDTEPELVASFAEPGAEDGAGPELHVEAPWDGYDRMRAQDIVDRLGAADEAVRAAVLLYERRRKNRVLVTRAALQSARATPPSKS
jgi:pimeloyl-ACP methyl ester carboxylesterase